MKEEWKNIKDYEGLYEISNYGRVKSLPKEWVTGIGALCFHDGLFLKQAMSEKGYLLVNLHKDKKQYTKFIHRLVWDHFGNKQRNGRKLQIDHIDNCKTNNNIDNLQLLTNRQNCSKSRLQHKKLSRYTGVTYDKKRKKWCSQIYISKAINLGRFNTEIDAHLAYQKALKVV